MGIKGLMKFLHDAAPKAIREVDSQAAYTGRSVAIDASMCLYQFLIMIRDNRQGSYQNLTNEDGKVTSPLVGMLSSMCEDFFHHLGHGHVARQQSLKAQEEAQKAEAKEGDKGDEMIDYENGPGSMFGPRPIQWGFVFVIFFGDFLHNFVDGIFIANAFLDCTQSKGWTITAATIAHEIAQETSDFFLLITAGGLTQIQALILNGLSGVSVLIGAAVFLWVDPGNGTRGLVLAFSGGTYVYIAATEAASVYTEKRLSPAMWGWILLLFVTGAVAIGLHLLHSLALLLL